MRRRRNRSFLPAEIRFRKFYTVDQNGCWIWTGTQSRGYASFHTRGETGWITVAGHKFSYELHHGPRPSGHELHHICRVKLCVNPAHLQLLTHREHMVITGADLRDSKTHCINGHLYDEPNTYWRPGRNVRKCRTCANVARRKIREKRRENAA